MKTTLKMTLAALVSASCWLLALPASADDGAKSMRGAEITTPDVAPEPKAYQGGKPGGGQKLARTFQGQPPVIPHAVTNFDEITLEENQCLTCHGADVYKKKNAPKVGDSHFMDRDGNKLAGISSLRHNCVQCHVPQVDAPPLVESTFKGVVAKSAGDKNARKKN